MKKKDIQTIMVQGMSFISALVDALIPEDEEEKKGEDNDKERNSSDN